MKVIGIAASPRKGKNSERILEKILEAVQEKDPGLTTEFVSLAGRKFSGCVSCDYCKSHFDCSQKDDLSEVLEKLKDPEIRAIILVSPVYMGGMSSQAKAFLDRTVLFRRNGFFFRNKIGAAATVGGSRNGGQEITLQSIHAAMMIHDMIVVADASPSSHFGGTAWEKAAGGLKKDETALETIRNTGYKVAEMIRLFPG